MSGLSKLIGEAVRDVALGKITPREAMLRMGIVDDKDVDRVLAQAEQEIEQRNQGRAPKVKA